MSGENKTSDMKYLVKDAITQILSDDEFLNRVATNLRVYGLIEIKDKISTDIFISMSKEKLNIDLISSEVVACHFMGKERKQLIVQFVLQQVKEQIMQCRKLLKGSKIVIGYSRGSG